MKKLILPIDLFISLSIFFFLASNVAAQTNIDCWNTHMVDQMAVCSKTHSQCLNTCTPLASSERIPCFNECSNALNSCYEKASGDYSACIVAEKKQKNAATKIDTTSAQEDQKQISEDPDYDCLENTMGRLGRDDPPFDNCVNSCIGLEHRGVDGIAQVGPWISDCIHQCQPYKTLVPCKKSLDSDQDQKQPPFDEAACHESCQTTYDTCTGECRSADIFNNSNSDTSASCRDKCNAVYNSTAESIRHECFNTWFSCGIAIYNRGGCEGSSCSAEVQEKCDKPYDACLQPAQDAADACLEDCGVETDQVLSPDADACFNTCEQTRTSCSQGCREAGQTARAAQNNQPSEKPQVGLSSKDFKALARANAEYQKAQADLEQIKQSDDPRWEAKKDVTPTNLKTDSDTFQQDLQKAKVVLERIRDGGSAYQDIKELYGLATKGTTGNYGPVSAITDVASGLTKFTEEVGKGVSVDNAFTKAALDVGAPSALIAYPPAFVADKVATIPDRVMNALGYPEKQGPRIVTGFLKDNSPSGFVELTTNSMIKTGNLTNVGGAVLVAVQDIQSADGIGGKLVATGQFVYTVVGAVPVAVVIGLRDFLFGPPVTQQTANYIYVGLTSSN